METLTLTTKNPMKSPFLAALPLLLFIACSKSDPEPAVTIDSSTLDLKYDGEHQFKLTKGTDEITTTSYAWKSSDEKVGTIGVNGLFEARKIGKTTIVATATDGKSVQSEVTISPYTTFLTEPIKDFYANKESIKSLEKRKLYYESTDGLIFEGDNSNVEYVGYTFKNGRVNSGIVIFNSTTGIVDLIGTFLSERYPHKGAFDGKIGFIDDEKKFAVVLSVDPSLGLNAIYIPYDGGGRVQGESIADIKAQYKKILN